MLMMKASNQMARKKSIMIHCLATGKSWMQGQSNEAKLAEVTRWHVQDNGWSAIAYAYVVFYDGTALKGRDMDGDGDVWEETGAGARGHNGDTIHIALEGGKTSTENDNFADHYTMEQNRTIRRLIEEAQQVYGPLKLEGHNEVAAKACPGFKVREWYAQKPPRSRLQSGTAQGAAAAGTGVAGDEAAEAFLARLDATTAEVENLAQTVEYLQYAFVALSIIGVGYALYCRLYKDWGRGRR